VKGGVTGGFMGKRSETITIGILAHVDAGKTTLAESMLYTAGVIRTPGRVDHKNAYLDNDAMERARGITIFSKQARFSYRNMNFVLVDTPGHVDFSAETERTLAVLDYAILVISAADGVSGHVLTLWRLLARHHVPVVLFVNKMDQPGTDAAEALAELTRTLSERIVDFTGAPEGAELSERIALCDEALLEDFLAGKVLSEDEIAAVIAQRKVFPCYFGSALRLTGVEAFMDGFSKYMRPKEYPDAFGARVYKISHDDKGNRLTFLKVTGGVLRVRERLPFTEEKINRLRLYSGAGYREVQEVGAGEICAAVGLSDTQCGDRLGYEKEDEEKTPVLQPVLTYGLILPTGVDPHVFWGRIRQLEEEDPMLRVNWEERSGRIEVQVMGEVQMEILKTMIADRFGVDVSFDAGAIVYKETLARPVLGRGHYEPLRHYAEVHLLMEPLPAGSGLVFDSRVSVDDLEMNWQRLILTHLAEKRHRGVLTGSELTDARLTLIAGQAHPKHTEGGDFRQATYRAVRQGLLSADNILLEPIYDFTLKVPTEQLGRAMTDLERMGAKFEPGEHTPEYAAVSGTCPVSTMREYRKEVMLYTRGFGELSCAPGGYMPCHNTEEVRASIGYVAEADPEEPGSSIFCAHGAGFLVEASEVPNYVHIREYPTGVLPRGMLEKEKGASASLDVSAFGRKDAGAGASQAVNAEPKAETPAERYARGAALDRELESIFRRTYGEKKETANAQKRTVYDTTKPEKEYVYKPVKKRDRYLLVDGYNILFSVTQDTDLRGRMWQDLREMVRSDISGARERLIEILSNYQGFRKMNLILVYDAYKVKGNPGEIRRRGNIDVVYTREAETADQFIEQVTKQIIKNAEVTVASSDGVEQIIIYGSGALRMSARELREEIDRTNEEIRTHLR